MTATAPEEAEDRLTSVRDELRALELDQMVIFPCEDRRTAELARGNICDFQRKDKEQRKFRSFQGELRSRKVPAGDPVKLYVIRVA